MKTRGYAVFFITLFLIGTMLVGCTAKKGAYGQPLSKINATPIGDILASPKQFERKTVRLEGKIVEECPAGGWFMLKDSTGIIYVDLHPSYFAIPQAVGSKVSAEGVVKKDGSRVLVVGKGVEIR